jgi:hypothetical protein
MIAASLLLAVSACSRERERAPAPRLGDRAGTPLAAPASEGEMHRLATALVSAKACELIRGRWAGIRDADRPTVTGTLWIRGCDVFVDGDVVSLVVNGSGWQWRDFTRERSDQARVVRETERFEVTATVKGSLAITYDDASRTMQIAFRPSSIPLWTLTPEHSSKLGRPEEQMLRGAILSAIFGAMVGRRTPEVLDLAAWTDPTAVTVSATA